MTRRRKIDEMTECQGRAALKRSWGTNSALHRRVQAAEAPVIATIAERAMSGAYKMLSSVIARDREAITSLRRELILRQSSERTVLKLRDQLRKGPRVFWFWIGVSVAANVAAAVAVLR